MTSDQTPESLILQSLQYIDDLRMQIKEHESECLRRVFLRFLIKKATLGSLINDVKPLTTPGRDNYVEYWFKPDMKGECFLMSRELFVWVEDGKMQHRLDIKYNPEFVKGNEL